MYYMKQFIIYAYFVFISSTIVSMTDTWLIQRYTIHQVHRPRSYKEELLISDSVLQGSKNLDSGAKYM